MTPVFAGLCRNQATKETLLYTALYFIHRRGDLPEGMFNVSAARVSAQHSYPQRSCSKGCHGVHTAVKCELLHRSHSARLFR